MYRTRDAYRIELAVLLKRGKHRIHTTHVFGVTILSTRCFENLFLVVNDSGV